MLRRNLIVSLFGLALALAGCPATNAPDGSIEPPEDGAFVDSGDAEPPVPDIPQEMRVIDLNDEQLTALCEYTLAMLGTSGEFCTNGQDYTLYAGTNFRGRNDPIGWCLNEYHILREIRPDCPQLVRSDIRFTQHVKAHCHDPDFNALDFDGHRGCMGP